MEEKFENIIKALKQVGFHDLPVKGFYVENDGEIIVRIDYFLHIESKNDYDEYSILFTEIDTVKFQ